MPEIKKVATREGYGKALVECGEKYPNLVVMDADLAASTKTGMFHKAYPDRFFDCGIAEANMMKKLDHPCLPRIVDIIDRKNVIYVVMDYIEGEPLSKILEKYGAQPQETVIEWAKELAGVLEYLHMQDPPIIYRDMKPANVMLQPNGHIKLIDFGIAREYKEQNVEDTVSLGTKGYAAPEQFGGKGQIHGQISIVLG